MLVIHAEPGIKWQGQFASVMQAGLKAIGLPSVITSNRNRESDIAIVLGTTLWREVEATGRYLLVDRASYGDPEYVSLVWDGHGRRGNHCVPDNPKGRVTIELQPWKAGERRILCGQTETYSPHYRTLNDWYVEIDATHFRKHPHGNNPTGLPLAHDWKDCGVAITLNSSVAVEAVIQGYPIITMDEGSMAWDVSSHYPNITGVLDRQPWLEWLSWTQWTHDEIRQGQPIKHLFEVM